jgi:ectoine hydroxylase-related dioxygenase (phytanoyl-CoA dioxygenase family)
MPEERAGTRLGTLAGIADLASATGDIGAVAASVLGGCAKPVRGLFFDKSEAVNWALDWHQDRTISVKERREADGFGPWSVKAGIPHVAPPVELLCAMITVRVHLDDVDSENAPLLIAPGSHRVGKIGEGEVEAVVAKCGTFACTATAGDIWLYSTPILHASCRASRPRRRRVLQIDYCARALPSPLEWRPLL